MGKTPAQVGNADAQLSKCNLCGSTAIKLVADVRTKPEHEKIYGKVLAEKKYYRKTYHCSACGVYCNIWNPAFDIAYEEDWVGTLYSDGLLAAYSKIRGFPFEKSDNKHRARRVDEYVRSHHFTPKNTVVLDVGCGTCVFLGEMKDLGYQGFAIDPDPRSIEHAKNNVGVRGFAGTLETYSGTEQFDVITFNKVLEHIRDPITTLRAAAKHLHDNGILYVELPEGDNAGKDSFVDREEFWIGHHNVYTEQSIRYLLEHAGFTVNSVHSIRDPSGKYTVFAFATKKG